MLYGGETWAIKEDDIRRLEGTDFRMCNVSLNEYALVSGILGT